MTETHVNYPRAGFVRRLAAMVYDALIATAVAMCAAMVIIVTLIVLLENHVLDKHGLEHASDVVQQVPVYQYIIQCWVLSWVIGFFLWFWKKGGQTLGMRAWRLRIYSTTDEPMGYGRALLRVFASLGGIGTLLVLVDIRNKQSLQDRVAQTEVLHLSVEGNDHKNW